MVSFAGVLEVRSSYVNQKPGGDDGVAQDMSMYLRLDGLVNFRVALEAVFNGDEGSEAARAVWAKGVV
eukprot:2884074-Lingulodinium_polyedra.AAC.1